jgi:hypothetical protein
MRRLLGRGERRIGRGSASKDGLYIDICVNEFEQWGVLGHVQTGFNL